jgi:cyanophycinase
MFRRGLCALLLGALVVLVPPAFAASGDAATIGPASGWLLMDGGGVVKPEILQRFVELAGGPEAAFVLIPTALADSEIDMVGQPAAMAEALHVTRLTTLHTRDRDVANSDAFVEPLRRASGVWFAGGRQWRLADAYLGTAVEREVKALLARGGVVGGTSAGATIQGSLLIRGQPGYMHDADGDNTLMLSIGHETGFGLLKNAAVDQHLNTRHRESDLEPVVASHPGLLGIGLDEGAAIVVHGDRFEVIGGRVTIFDGARHDGALHYFLGPGQVYDLKNRAVEAGAEQK